MNNNLSSYNPYRPQSTSCNQIGQHPGTRHGGAHEPLPTHNNLLPVLFILPTEYTRAENSVRLGVAAVAHLKRGKK